MRSSRDPGSLPAWRRTALTGFYATIPATGDPAALAVDPDGRVVLNSSGMLRRFDSAGNITLSKAILNSLAPTVAVDAGGNIYVTGYSNQLPPVRNSLATCGSDFLGVLAPDGSVLQTTYIPGGVGSYAFIALGSNSTVFVMDSANSGFMPSRNGPFSSGPAANSTQVTAFLWHLSPHPDAQTYPLACLGNSASYISAGFPISPGTMVTLTGNGLGPIEGIQTSATPQSPFPTQAGNVQVTFDGKPAPLVWVQDAQINAIAPWSLMPGQTTKVCVTYNGVKTNCLAWPVSQTSPGVFTVDGTHAAAVNQDGTLNSAANPAAPGSIVSIFATGLGAITPAQDDGTVVVFPLPTDSAPTTVNAIQVLPPFGGTTITPFDVTYVGPAPLLVAGASRINFRVVRYAGSIMVQSGFASSNGFLIYVAGQ